MGKAKSCVIDVIKVKITRMGGTGLPPKIVECNYWQWAGPEETAVDIFRVHGGRLARDGGYNNVAAVEEV